MQFALTELDITEPTSTIDQRIEQQPTDLRGRCGGVLLRHGNRLVGLRMFDDRTSLPVGRTDLLAGEVGDALVCDQLRDLLRESSNSSSPEDHRTAPRVSIAICTRARTQMLSRLLDSLKLLRGQPPFEVLVIDNAPPDDQTRDLVSGYSGVRHVVEPCEGLDFARNRALAEARGDVLAYLDDDVIVDPGWLDALRSVWRDNPDAGCVTGLVLPLVLDTRAQFLFERRGGFGRGFLPLRWGGSVYDSTVHPCDAGKFGAGANMSLRVSLLRRIGGFDEALDTGRALPGGGDLDIFYRVLRSGATLVYEPRAAVFHEHRREMPQLSAQYHSWGKGFMAFLVKHLVADRSKRRSFVRLLVWWFLYQATRLLAPREPTPRAMIWQELLGGIVGLGGEYGRSKRRSAGIRSRSSSGPALKEAGDSVIELPTSTAAPGWTPCGIRHVRIDRPLPELAVEQREQSLLVVFWWQGLALGSRLFSRMELPIAASALPALVATECAQALRVRLAQQSENWATNPDVVSRSILDRLAESACASSSTPPTTSVVVCTRNRPEALARCLDSLLALEPAPSEILVVDNSPTDQRTRSVTEQRPGVRYVEEPRAGLSFARNRAIEASIGEIVAFTDDDVEVPSNWLGPLLRHFDDPQVDAVAGLILPEDLAEQGPFSFEFDFEGLGKGFAPRRFDSALVNDGGRKAPPVWDIGAGANMALRKSCFDRIGRYDPSLGAGASGCSEDSELFYRVLRNQGVCVYEPASVVFHQHRASPAALRGQVYAYLRGHVTGLLTQNRYHPGAGNLRRAFVDLPIHYARKSLRLALFGPTGAWRLLPWEILGVVVGPFSWLKWRFKHRAARREAVQGKNLSRKRLL